MLRNIISYVICFVSIYVICFVRVIENLAVFFRVAFCKRLGSITVKEFFGKRFDVG